jgi:hypothetical protein
MMINSFKRGGENGRRVCPVLPILTLKARRVGQPESVELATLSGFILFKKPVALAKQDICPYLCHISFS